MAKKQINTADPDLLKIMSKRLIAVRTMLGLTQKEIAEMSGVAQNNFYQYEKGLTFIPHEMISALADKHNVNPNFIYGYTDNPLFAKKVKRTSPSARKIILDI